MLSVALESIFLRKCLSKGTHDDGSPDVNAYYVTPQWNETVKNPENEDKTPVVAVHGNEELRLFSLTCGKPGVIRMGACLKCCLRVCRSDKKYKYVVC